MQLRQAGELKLLEEIRRRFNLPSRQADKGVIIGIGDDAAAIAPTGENLLVTADLMHEGVHFDLDYTSPFHLGFKLVSVNVSDIMAMGGVPRYLFLTLSMKADTEVAFFTEFYDGIETALGRYGIELLGGDLSAARNDMVFSATVVGACGRLITRRGAAPGDRIYVTSATGDAACGLELLRRLTPESRAAVKKSLGPGREGTPACLRLAGRDDITIDWKTAEPLLLRHLMPVARDMNALSSRITSMIDVSDGLSIDLCRICDESGVGARVYLDKIPVSESMRVTAGTLGLPHIELAIAGGEDYELLFTVPRDFAEAPELENVFYIGEITNKERIIVDSAGREAALKTEGYRHFGIA